jgi:hypothetical protein
MGIFSFTAYVHHYYNPLILSQINFYSYCNGYLESPTLNSPILSKYKDILFLFLFPFFIIPNNYNLIYLSVITAILGFSRLSQLSIAGYLMKTHNVSNIHILIYIIHQIINIYI